MTKTKKKTTTNKRHRSSAVNGILVILMCFVVLAAIGAVVMNVINIAKTETATGNVEPTSNTTVKSMRNDLYEIGNNPTDVEKEECQKLSDAVKAEDDMAMAEAVARNFVCDYFTWTNKDGNYEIGGLQYIYAEKIAGFELWSRYNFYSDLDLYISQIGRNKLIEVSSVTTDSISKAPDFVYERWLDTGVTENVIFESYEVNLSWTYASNSTIANNFPTAGRFFVIKSGNRFEIAEFYDMESILEWEAENPSGGN